MTHTHLAFRRPTPLFLACATLAAACGSDGGALTDRPAVDGGPRTVDASRSARDGGLDGAVATARIEVEDQTADPASEVTVARVRSPGPGFVVIREDRGWQPLGAVRGVRAVAAGHSANVVVTLETPLSEETRLHAVLHRDTGAAGEFEHRRGSEVDGPLRDEEGDWIAAPFTARLPRTGGDGGMPRDAQMGEPFAPSAVDGPEGRFRFRRLVRTGMPWPGARSSFGRIKRVTTNGRDTLAFTAFDDAVDPDFPFGRGAVFVVEGDYIRMVADTGTLVPDGTGRFRAFRWTRPYLHGDDVAFRAYGPNGLLGVYASFEGRPLERIVDNRMMVPGPRETIQNLGQPSLEGRVLSFSDLVPNFGGVYQWDDGDLRLVYDTSTPVPGQPVTFTSFAQTRSHDGKVAFQGLWSIGDDHEQGLYTDLGGSLSRVGDSLNEDPLHPGNRFRQFWDPVFVQDGRDDRIVFMANYAIGRTALYQWDGSELSLFVDHGDPIPGRTGGFVSLAANFCVRRDRVVFTGGWETDDDVIPPGQGVYLWRGGELERVIDRTQTLDGRTPVRFKVHNTSLFGTSFQNVAFWVEFADGSMGIYLAIDRQSPDPI
jgi:hypothetical protein